MRRALLVLLVAVALAAPATASGAPIDWSCSPAPVSCDAWYRQPVTLTWTLSGTPDPGTCVDVTVKFDTAPTPFDCRLGSAHVTVWLKVDQTPPIVTRASASRPPDHNGWYRSPVRVTFSGTDATSGLRGCSSTTYSGPNAAAVDLLGRCQDVAGNLSAATPFGLRYDSAPPTISDVSATASDHAVRLRWNIPDASAVAIWRSRAGGKRRAVYSGSPKGSLVDRHLRNGRRYRYDVTATDPAGNIATRSLTIAPGPRLLAPAHRARVTAAPLLRWTKVRGADYYNVQLFRGGRKVLSAWPTRARLQLDRRWRYGGELHRLKNGRRYRWFVWPGYGPRARNDYGRLIGTSTFTVGAP